MSKYLDLGLYRKILGQTEKSITLRYDVAQLNMDADFVKTYFNWLSEEKSIKINDDIQVAPFMHASNGGVKINERAETRVPGLFAAGEVTGGMHGADRIGGLSTANGLVFGKIAGENAAKYAQDSGIKLKNIPNEFNPIYIPEAKEKIKAMRSLMDERAFLE